MNYRMGRLLGRLANGFESDKGTLTHAVVIRSVKPRPCPWNDWGRDASKMAECVKADIGLCGARPGRRSVGWAFDVSEVTCPRCLKRLPKG